MKKLISFALVIVILVTALSALTFSASAAAAGYPSISASKPLKTYAISTGNTTPTYGSQSTSNRIGYIYGTDEIYVDSISGNWAHCTYPVTGGRKAAYIQLSVITSATGNSFATSPATAQVTTYWRSNTNNTYGYVSKGDTVYAITTANGFTQIIYPISGGWKLGWVTTANYNAYLASPTPPTTPPAAAKGVQGTYYAPIQTGAHFSSASTEVGSDGKSWTGQHDIAVSSGTPVYAIADGTISCQQAYTVIGGSQTLTSYGNNIRFTSSDGKTKAVYAHLNSFANASLVIPSSRTKMQSGSSGSLMLGTYSVKKGDIIGYVGQTGNATGPHLHFELYINGTRVNPPSYLGM